MERSWRRDRERGPAAALHGRAIPLDASRSVAVLEVASPALVLGSTQPAEHVDLAAAFGAGVDVVRRRSGGGAVLLVPGDAAWIDVVVPRGDPLWEEDVAAAFGWLGSAWVAALAELGVPGLVHTGPLRPGPWSGHACFAGLGPGEVTTGGRKVVGLAQRRERAGARFQCVIHRRWDPDALVGLLALGDARPAASAHLAAVATGLDRPHEEVVDALLRHLPG